MNKESGLIDMIRDLKGYKENEKWIKRFNEKYENVKKEYDININFTIRNIKPNNKDSINLMFKNDIKEIRYTKNSRKYGFYIIILNVIEKPVLFIGVGQTFVDQLYKIDRNQTDEICSKMEKYLYQEAIKKLEKNGQKFKYWDKNQNKKYIDTDNLDNNDIHEMIEELKAILEVYPEIMNKYNEKNNIEKYVKNYKLCELTKEKDSGKTFTLFIWNYINQNEGIDPKFIKENNIQDKEESNNRIIRNNKEIGTNLIVYGVPGSGKSYYIENELLKGVDKEKYVKRVTFYPEYTYYDFVGQKIPASNGNGLIPEMGPFTRILNKALESEKNKTGEHFYLIIEELNRGNAEAVFGDLFQLLDRDEKGKSRYSIDNQFISEALDLEDKTVYLPSNLSIYATINNADQNVFNMDTAFGRRWNYELKMCNIDKNVAKNDNNKIFFDGYIKGTNIKWNDFRNDINRKIIKEKEEIFNAEDKRMGLYYIDKQLLEIRNDEKDIDNQNDNIYREKFANKIFRYLYLNVFKNDLGQIFKNSNEKTLEDYIIEFKKEGDIKKILKELGDENESRD